MVHEYPEYLDEFECIGGHCTDTCCSGWEFDIDPETAEIYKELPGEDGEYVRSKLTHSEDGSLCIRPVDGGRCPFLNERNLCDLILKYGDNVLSDPCAEYPRYYTDYGDYEAVDMSLSCKEVGRLFFTRDGRPTVYKKVEDDMVGDALSADEKSRLAERIKVRDGMIREIYSKSEDVFVNDAGFLKSDEDEAIFYKLDKLEYYHYRWDEYLKKLSEARPEIEERTQEFFEAGREDILRWFRYFSEYLVFRYTLSDLAAGVPIEDTMRFIKRSLRIVYMALCFRWIASGESDVESMIDIAHYYSKEVEHNLWNVATLRE